MIHYLDGKAIVYLERVYLNQVVCEMEDGSWELAKWSEIIHTEAGAW